MKAPDFWRNGGPLSVALAPLGWMWAVGSAWRGARTVPYRTAVPVICVGNLVAGGAGKTPVALSIAHRIAGAQFLSRGYGGKDPGPLRVDLRHHNHQRVGDESLLLAEIAPCWIARDRVAGAKAAVKAGARVLVMDDGFQDPSLTKDLSFLVVDGPTGFGSGRCIPAGPLREPVTQGLRRANAVVILGDDVRDIAHRVGALPVLRARLEPEAEAAALEGLPVVAFAGIGRPDKFFRSLDKLGAVVKAAYAFPDHHPYHATEIGELIAAAGQRSAALITTTKDYVRVPAHLRSQVTVLRVTVTWEDEEALLALLDSVRRDG
jgi:tetraacyldisaccharide 4'-kinase